VFGNKVATALAAACPAPLRYAGQAPAWRLRCSFVMRRRAGRVSGLRPCFRSAAQEKVPADAGDLFMMTADAGGAARERKQVKA